MDSPPNTTAAPASGMVVLRNDVFTNGVNYFEFAVDLVGLPPALYDWLPRYTDAFNKLGAAGQDYARIAERRAACTGGLSAGVMIARHAAEPGRCLRQLRFGLKTLDAQAAPALQLLTDLVFGLDPRDRGRLRDVITQARAGQRSTLVNDGLGTARRQAARGLSPEAALDHRLLSPATLRQLEALHAGFDQQGDGLIERIAAVREFIADEARWTVSFTGSDAVFALLGATLREWSARFRHGSITDQPVPFAAFDRPPREGWAGPMQVAHCVRVMPAPHLAEPDVPLLRLGLYLANFDYLLPAIRFKGNAYGGGGRHDDALGILYLYSYRDPHIVETLQVFDGLRDWVAAQTWTQTDVDRAIIGSAKEAERPIRPAEATSLALLRHLRGDTNARREQRYTASLAATPAAVQAALLRVLDANAACAAVGVVSSREKLAAANRELGAAALAVQDILP